MVLCTLNLGLRYSSLRTPGSHDRETDFLTVPDEAGTASTDTRLKTSRDLSINQQSL